MSYTTISLISVFCDLIVMSSLSWDLIIEKVSDIDEKLVLDNEELLNRSLNLVSNVPASVEKE